MIQPDFNLMLWILFIVYSAKGIVSIIAGARGDKKDRRYGGLDVLGGLITLVLMMIVAFG